MQPRKWALVRPLLSLLLLLIIALWSVCQRGFERTRLYYRRSPIAGSRVGLRAFPYPFRAAITIANDPDGTRSLSEFLTIQEFLNTHNQTALGAGLGLEIANSFFAKDPHFGLVSQNSADGEVIPDLIRLGYIDSLHSFDKATTRQEILTIVRLLSEKHCRIPVWINHSHALSNLGADAESLGDDVGAPVYHSDFSAKELGYIFVWEGAVSGVLGQGRPISFGSFLDAFDRHHPFLSLYEFGLKEPSKYILATLGVSRYSMRRRNELAVPARLDDGRAVFEFTRSSFCSGGLWGDCATAMDLADTLRASVLENASRTEGYTVLYTHLGINRGFPYLPPEARQVLELLARENRAGKIYVTTTSRLLTYYVNRKYLKWNVESGDDSRIIRIESISDPVRGTFIPDLEDLRGITFYTDNPERTRILIGARLVTDVQENGRDYLGRKSVMIRLRPLESIDRKMQDYRARGLF